MIYCHINISKLKRVKRFSLNNYLFEHAKALQEMDEMMMQIGKLSIYGGFTEVEAINLDREERKVQYILICQKNGFMV